jgi:hypothetical protein
VAVLAVSGLMSLSDSVDFGSEAFFFLRVVEGAASSSDVDVDFGSEAFGDSVDVVDCVSSDFADPASEELSDALSDELD